MKHMLMNFGDKLSDDEFEFFRRFLDNGSLQVSKEDITAALMPQAGEFFGRSVPKRYDDF